ncbi:TetR/AcrR family transcriptional regulator [Actinomycetospora soli]|uniref:TetR/AcrR family transcriptional regulator n=1 Tax=Actinomycetospora soli TaxID=2893887 RepID=UPI001E31327C|nr:TetR/AcrR family transcriptional regulator [Actinomycetospora soli]MCD2190575.1 TetR/AcrR family transcriptional regulator [Actinomycetospora soli]
MPRTQERTRSTRDRMVDSAATLLREYGTAATTIDAVLAHSSAPRGSVYHHFPGGRRELLTAAVTRAGDLVSDLLAGYTAAADSPSAILRRFASLWRTRLVATDHRAGCPLVAVAVDHPADEPELVDLVRTIVERWTGELRGGLVAQGIPPGRAATLAALVLSSIEGAVVLCRVEGSAAPLDAVVAELEPLLDSAARQTFP